jgi:hypothetical protein
MLSPAFNPSGDPMDLDRTFAAAGLVALACGILSVNLVPTPRVAQAGTIVATFGLALLAWLAVHRLLS